MTRWRCAPVVGMALVFLWCVPRLGAQTEPRTVVVHTTESYYELADTSLTDVIARLNQMTVAGAGGQASQGLTEYQIEPSWRPAGARGSCRISNLTLDVRIVITLPVWPGQTLRPEDEQASWAVIEEAIRSHEYRHRDMTVEAAEDLAKNLLAIETRGCRALEQAFAGRVALAGRRLREAHAQYDRETPVRLSVGDRGGSAPREGAGGL